MPRFVFDLPPCALGADRCVSAVVLELARWLLLACDYNGRWRARLLPPSVLVVPCARFLGLLVAPFVHVFVYVSFF